MIRKIAIIALTAAGLLAACERKPPSPPRDALSAASAETASNIEPEDLARLGVSSLPATGAEQKASTQTPQGH